MPTEKPKPASKPKSDNAKKSPELRDDDLRAVSGGLTSRAGVGVDPDKCITSN